MKKERSSNIELLRIIAMLFVVTLHYLGKGGALLPWGDENFGTNTYIAWAINAFALVAVNVYVLISGYFLAESKFRLSRILKIWFQVFFYSAGVWLVLLALGMVPSEFFAGYWISMFLLPITSQHYWFASSYIFMCLLAPFMGVAVRKMTKRQLQTCIVVLMLLFSRIWRIVLPMSTPIDDRGYGIIWFVCLFVIAAYIRLYVPANGKWVKPLLIYVASSAALFLSLPVLGTITQKVGKMVEYYDVLYEYNAPLTIIGAVALFLAFRNMKIGKGNAGKVLNWVAGCTFGVYLLHEHALLRGFWNSFWNVNEMCQTSYFVPHMIGVVLAVFLAGCIAEAFRQVLFFGISKIFRTDKISSKLEKVDVFFNEKESK